MKKLSFVGAGNMGKAILEGVLKSAVIAAENIMVSDLSEHTLETVKKGYDVKVCTDSKTAVEFGDIVIFAVKPNVMADVLEYVKGAVSGGKILISIAAAISISMIEELLGSDMKIIRAMPNTPALVGEAMSAVAKNGNISDDDMKLVLEIFNSFGKAELVPEYLMDAVTGVSGSGPAYVFMFIEAMADAAVLYGMPREKAYKFAAQTAIGAAKMLLETGKHPGELKDMVCSPGGTTIEAVTVMEEYGLRNAVIKGQIACTEKSIRMSKK